MLALMAKTHRKNAVIGRFGAFGSLTFFLIVGEAFGDAFGEAAFFVAFFPFFGMAMEQQYS